LRLEEFTQRGIFRDVEPRVATVQINQSNKILKNFYGKTLLELVHCANE
jgi:hypothetical protein